MGGSTLKDWVRPAETQWDIWVEYCEKVNKWYHLGDANPELEPFGMNPPRASIVEGTLYANQSLISCRKEMDNIIEVLKEHSGGKDIGIPHLYAMSIVLENKTLRQELIGLQWNLRKYQKAEIQP